MCSTKFFYITTVLESQAGIVACGQIHVCIALMLSAMNPLNQRVGFKLYRADNVFCATNIYGLRVQYQIVLLQLKLFVVLFPKVLLFFVHMDCRTVTSCTLNRSHTISPTVC